MLKGFKDFIMRGNLVELAVAFVIATAFAAVVVALVDVLMDLVGKAGGTPDFSNYEPGGVSVGAFLTALIAFLILAAVVYFFVVMPYNNLMERMVRGDEEVEVAPTGDIILLQEIRDLLAAQRGGTTGGTTGGTAAGGSHAGPPA